MNEIKVFSRNEYPLLKQIEKQIPERYGCVYILEYGKYVKIGCSSKPYKRLVSLKSNAESYGDCQLGRIAILPCCRNFGVIEGFLHELFSEYRKSGSELFSVNLETVLEEVAKHDINYKSKIEVELVQKEEKKTEDKKTEDKSYSSYIYYFRKLGELE